MDQIGAYHGIDQHIKFIITDTVNRWTTDQFFIRIFRNGLHIAPCSAAIFGIFTTDRRMTGKFGFRAIIPGTENDVMPYNDRGFMSDIFKSVTSSPSRKDSKGSISASRLSASVLYLRRIIQNHKKNFA